MDFSNTMAVFSFLNEKPDNEYFENEPLFRERLICFQGGDYMQKRTFTSTNIKSVNYLPVVKNFKKIIESRDICKMNKELYQFLNLHCGFIAHYNLDGFKATYKDQKILLIYSFGILMKTIAIFPAYIHVISNHTRTQLLPKQILRKRFSK